MTLAILAILVGGALAIPSLTSASYATYTIPNPAPSVDSISPNAANSGEVVRSIMINGSGFVPSSVAKINGANRVTTFIDENNLLMQVNAGDTYRTDGGFYVTVWNRAPGGGYSNGSFFTVTSVAPAPVAYNNQQGVYPYNNNVYTNAYPAPAQTYTYNPTPAPASDSARSLASNAIYGSNTFLPSGLTQWVLFGIIIMLIIILIRKIFGATDRYHETPLKID